MGMGCCVDGKEWMKFAFFVRLEMTTETDGIEVVYLRRLYIFFNCSVFGGLREGIPEA